MQSQADKTYEKITERILALLEQGVVPWHRPWRRGMTPTNPYTPTTYSGINSILLWATMLDLGWEDPRFATFNQIKQALIEQAKARGDITDEDFDEDGRLQKMVPGGVKKGSVGTPVVYYVPIMDRDVEAGEEPTVKYLRPKYYTVFNLVEQTEGLEIEPLDIATPTEFTPIELAEITLKAYVNQDGGPKYNHNGGNKAFYRPSTDHIHMPQRYQFDSEVHYYSVAFHESIHSTGHSSRLAREGVAKVDTFNIERYSKEELIAEMGATFLCAECDIEDLDVDNSAAYIKSWMEALSDDKKMLMQAAAEAQKAVEFILSKQLVTASV